MEVGAIIGLVFGLVAALIIALVVLGNSLYVVHQAEGIVIERLGKFHRILGSGLNAVVPFIDRPRKFTWTLAAIERNGGMRDKHVTGYRIDLREAMFNFLRQEVYTRDTVLLDVNALMYYRIVDVRRAIYEVDDLQAALSNTAQTQLKEVFGNLTFSDAIKSQNEISEHLSREFGKLFYGWGIHVERMELLDLMPKKNTQDVMQKQMIAERTRRGEFIRSEGNKTATRLQAEGEKLVRMNLGMAQQEATKRVSEAEKEARIMLATAERTALEAVADATNKDGNSNSQYQLAQRYIEMYRGLCANLDNSHIYLPYDASAVRGLVGALHSSFGPGLRSTWRGMSAAPSAGAPPALVDGDDDDVPLNLPRVSDKFTELS